MISLAALDTAVSATVGGMGRSIRANATGPMVSIGSTVYMFILRLVLAAPTGAWYAPCSREFGFLFLFRPRLPDTALLRLRYRDTNCQDYIDTVPDYLSDNHDLGGQQIRSYNCVDTYEPGVGHVPFGREGSYSTNFFWK